MNDDLNNNQEPNQDDESNNAFSYLLGNQGGNPDNGATELDIQDVEKQALDKQNRDKDEFIRQLQEENNVFKKDIEGLKSNSEYVDKLKGVFGSDEAETTRIKRDAMTREFDLDPIRYSEDIARSEVESLRQEVRTSQNVGHAERAMRSIDMDYDVDWERNKMVIKEEMNNFSQDYIKKDFKKAILRAAILTGVAKKREGVPEYFAAGGMSPTQMAKAQQTDADKYKNNIFMGKKQSNNDVMSKLQNEIFK